MRKLLAALLALLLLSALLTSGLAETIRVFASEWPVEENGRYSSMEQVAVYLATYNRLPVNYITKRDAQALGWEARRGNLWRVTDHCSIGGDRFGNYEGLLPAAKGRRYTECDIDFDGRYRNSRRIIFSNDGLMFFTQDHYNSFDEIEIVWDTEVTAP